jgi:hypothetical protein
MSSRGQRPISVHLSPQLVKWWQFGSRSPLNSGPEGRQGVAHGVSHGTVQPPLVISAPGRGGSGSRARSVAPSGAVNNNATFRPTPHAVGYLLAPLRAFRSPGALSKRLWGNAPGNVIPSPPFPSPRPRGEGCRRRGVGASVRGFHPRLLNLLPSAEYGCSRSRPSTLRSRREGFETTSRPAACPGRCDSRLRFPVQEALKSCYNRRRLERHLHLRKRGMSYERANQPT